MNKFRRLTLQGWQQFKNVDIEFHKRLTILTGANGSGKTSILNLLARHVGWDAPSLAVPRLSTASRAWEWFTRLFGPAEQENSRVIGNLHYDGSSTKLTVPVSSGASYQVAFTSQQSVDCFFVPSHRAVFRYQPVSQIPAARRDKDEAFNQSWSSMRNRYYGGSSPPTNFHIKETLVSWSIFGRGNVDMPADQTLLSYYEGFQETLKRLLPASIGFKKFSIRNLEVVLECGAGDFIIDGVSGGLSALIDLAWQIYMYSRKDREQFTVLIDEVENHLHPTMQRRILPDLLDAFPNVTFVVSTHAPLVVSSVRDSAIFVLRYDGSEIVSEQLDLVQKARTATQILNEVLGVPSTLPIWAEKDLEAIVSRFVSGEISERRLAELREQLRTAGLDGFIPQAIAKIAEDRHA